jgi:peptidoglycan/LPS O-acetylase OafA/YrhL
VLFFMLLSVALASENPVQRMLAWRPLVALGTMSYSLYLVHQPLIQLLADWLRVARPDLSPTVLFFTFVALLPIILVIAYGLFMLVERRTLGPDASGALVLPRAGFGWLSINPRAAGAAGEQA